jgi:hypothetical protein
VSETLVIVTGSTAITLQQRASHHSLKSLCIRAANSVYSAPKEPATCAPFDWTLF